MTKTTRNFLLLALLPLLGIMSCRKDDDGGTPTTRTPTAAGYMPGAPGSYWIYETYMVDSNGNGVPGQWTSNQPLTDSFYLISDTTVEGRNFHRMMGPSEAGSHVYETTYYRDSAMYLLGLRGDTLFAATDTNRVFRRRAIPGMPVSMDSAIVMSVSFGDKRTKQVPLGSFETLAMITDWAFHPYASESRPVTHRKQFKRFAAGVGIVSETVPFYALDARYMERRLVRSRVFIPIE